MFGVSTVTCKNGMDCLDEKFKVVPMTRRYGTHRFSDGRLMILKDHTTNSYLQLIIHSEIVFTFYSNPFHTRFRFSSLML